MPRLLTLRFVALSVAMTFVLACTSLPRQPQPSDFADVREGFSGQLAQAHLEALGGIGDRLPGSESDEIARAYLARAFRQAGAAVEEPKTGNRRHLVAELKGASHDVVLLVAAYPAIGSRAAIDDSGAALFLELARAVGASKQPYTLHFALADTRVIEGVAASGGDELPTPPVAERDRRTLLIQAGRELASGLPLEAYAERIRAIIVFDLWGRSSWVFARDLQSHPGFRKIFWDRAARIGADSMFPIDADWAAPQSLQIGFRERGLDRILALIAVDRSGAARDVSGGSAVTAGSRVRDFDALGRVLSEGLSDLMRRFRKVDAF